VKAAELSAGPSGGVLGTAAGIVDRDLYENHPEMARALAVIGRHPRAGHDRERWKTVDWEEYLARVGVCGNAGPWSVVPVKCNAGDVTDWVLEAERLPPSRPGWYTSLQHRDRGLVMSDIPAEVAGALPFLDFAESVPGSRILIAGLGLGIVPARLLRFGDVARIDVVEIDADVIALVTGDADEDAPNDWAADPRLHVHHADALTWKPPAGMAWDAAWFDVWDTVSSKNLPSMKRLHRRYARRVARGRMWSWERAECEAMLRRGQTLDRPCVTLGEGWRMCSTGEGGQS
jgi:SAM-dependent methyltransferase